MILDEPTQSLGGEFQAGVARAVERLASTCQIVIADHASPLVERLRDFVSVPRRIFRFVPYEETEGVRLEEKVEEL